MVSLEKENQFIIRRVGYNFRDPEIMIRQVEPAIYILFEVYFLFLLQRSNVNNHAYLFLAQNLSQIIKKLSLIINDPDFVDIDHQWSRSFDPSGSCDNYLTITRPGVSNFFSSFSIISPYKYSYFLYFPHQFVTFL